MDVTDTRCEGAASCGLKFSCCVAFLACRMRRIAGSRASLSARVAPGFSGSVARRSVLGLSLLNISEKRKLL